MQAFCSLPVPCRIFLNWLNFFGAGALTQPTAHSNTPAMRQMECVLHLHEFIVFEIRMRWICRLRFRENGKQFTLLRSDDGGDDWSAICINGILKWNKFLWILECRLTALWQFFFLLWVQVVPLMNSKRRYLQCASIAVHGARRQEREKKKLTRCVIRHQIAKSITRFRGCFNWIRC